VATHVKRENESDEGCTRPPADYHHETASDFHNARRNCERRGRGEAFGLDVAGGAGHVEQLCQAGKHEQCNQENPAGKDNACA